MARLILAFGHRRMRGKDTAGMMALELLLKQGCQVRRDAFAGPLKKACQDVFGFSDDQVYGDLKGEEDPFWHFTPRWALQFVGTELFRRHIREDIWAASLQRRAINEPEISVIVTDLRFKNEAQAIKDIGGFVVKCDRNVPYDEKIDEHQSEIDMLDYDGWDFALDNNHSMSTLNEQVATVVDVAWQRVRGRRP